VEAADGSLKALKPQREALAAVVGGAEHWLSAQLLFTGPSCAAAPSQLQARAAT
jgi:hypothetical protein